MWMQKKKVRRLGRLCLSLIGRPILSLRCRFGPTVAMESNQACTVIVASYGRPQNLQAIIAALVTCDFIRKIVISNHNPEVCLDQYINSNDERLKIINATARRDASYRFKVANTIPDEYFLILDDDIFMFPGQVRKLFLHLLKEPDVPHGFHGTCYISDEEKKRVLKRNHMSRIETTVDVLHQGYAVTAQHIERMLEISAELDASACKSMAHNDDILISLSGLRNAKIHNLGFVMTCSSSQDPKISISRRPGFGASRDRLFLYLTKLSVDRTNRSGIGFRSDHVL